MAAGGQREELFGPRASARPNTDGIGTAERSVDHPLGRECLPFLNSDVQRVVPSSISQAPTFQLLSCTARSVRSLLPLTYISGAGIYESRPRGGRP